MTPKPPTPVAPTEAAACACLNVNYKPFDNGDGSMRERWLCRDCGSEFCRRYLADSALATARSEGRAAGLEEAARVLDNLLLIGCALTAMERGLIERTGQRIRALNEKP